MKILIVDDQKNQIEYLEIQLMRSRLEKVELVKTQSPIEAMKLLKQHNFDLLFLDVEMPEMTGFEVIEILGIDNLPPVIFTTAYGKYAVNAFRVNAVDFLLKPIDPEELDDALAKIQEKPVENQSESLSTLMEHPLISNDERLVITQGQTYLFVHHDDIVRIEGSGSYSEFYLTDGRKLTTSKRLNVYWKRLSETTFLRPHQSHVVNQKYIQGYSKTDGGSLILQFDHSVPVSSNMRNEIKQYLKV